MGSLILAAALVASAATEGKAPKLNVSNQPIDRDGRMATSYASVVKKVAPSVVNIYSTKKIRVPGFVHPFLDDPIFRRFFGNPFGGQSAPQTRKAQSLGSGVVVSEDGYILTNNHVVDDADEIKVVLSDGTTEYDAKIVGRDPLTDVAVVKVDAKLKPITLADSGKLEVGDVVLAIGNPFGVGQTVTHGIISAVGRGGFGITDYEDFIQTDAAINPGNSGGALVDTEGRLIGINQSIVSGSGSSSGVGFAIPINLARSVLERLVVYGKVTRGYLGVQLQPLEPELVHAFKLPDQNGALIRWVQPNSPAATAGLKEGDVILEMNGKSVSDYRHLRLMISELSPKTKVTLRVLRDGKEKTLSATLGVMPEDGEMSQNVQEDNSPVKSDVLNGIEFSDIDSRTRRASRIPQNIRGALVTGVDSASAAYDAGLRRGDVVIEVNRKAVQSAEEAVDAAQDSKDGRLLLRIWSSEGGQGTTRYLAIGPSK